MEALTSKQNQRLADETLRVAEGQLGVHEATGRNDGRSVNMYQDFVARGLHGQPWCACFVSWCMYVAAEKLELRPVLERTASSAEFYQEGRRKGLSLAQPIPGCIGLLRGGAAGHEHTFLVISIDHAAGVVHTIDGNWGNAVAHAQHPIRDCDFVAVA